MIQLFPLKLIPKNLNLDFMKIRKLNIKISIFLALVSILLVAIKGINFSIDFTGGAVIEANLKATPNLQIIYNKLNESKFEDVTIQSYDNSFLMIKIGLGKNNEESFQTKIKDLKNSLTYLYPEIEFRKTDFVGPQVGKQLIYDGVISILLSLIGIMIYITIRFDFKYGLGILIALAHDVLVTMGFISAFHIEFSLTTIAAILTVIGYSVNDSVVIYDRIRENMLKINNPKLENIINLSINETMSRTFLTIFTTLLAVISLLFFGGPALFSFSVVVFFGIVIGTYSSIYIAAPNLVNLDFRNKNRTVSKI